MAVFASNFIGMLFLIIAISVISGLIPDTLSNWQDRKEFRPIDAACKCIYPCILISIMLNFGSDSFLIGFLKTTSYLFLACVVFCIVARIKSKEVKR